MFAVGATICRQREAPLKCNNSIDRCMFFRLPTRGKTQFSPTADLMVFATIQIRCEAIQQWL